MRKFKKPSGRHQLRVISQSDLSQSRISTNKTSDSLHISDYTVKLLATAICVLSTHKGLKWFFLSCKANARVKPAKTGHGPHSS